MRGRNNDGKCKRDEVKETERNERDKVIEVCESESCEERSKIGRHLGREMQRKANWWCWTPRGLGIGYKG